MGSEMPERVWCGVEGNLRMQMYQDTPWADPWIDGTVMVATEYVRADRYTALAEENARLRAVAEAARLFEPATGACEHLTDYYGEPCVHVDGRVERVEMCRVCRLDVALAALAQEQGE